MPEHHSAPIRALRVRSGVLRGLSCKPDCINLILGANGTGKTSLAAAIADGECLMLRDPKQPPERLVFDRSFVRRNLRQFDALPGLVALREQDIALMEQIRALEARIGELQQKIADTQAQVEALRQQERSDLEQLQRVVWARTAHLRERFPEAFADLPDARRLTQQLLFTMPRYYNEYDLSVDYRIICVPDRRSYPFFRPVDDTAVLDRCPGTELLASPIVSSADTAFAAFLRRVGSADWVRRGHDAYAHRADDACPYCGQRLPTHFEAMLAEAFDEQFRTSVSALRTLRKDYCAAANALFQPLKTQLKGRYPGTEYGLYLEHLRELRTAIAENLRLISKKLTEPSMPVTLQPTEPLLKLLNEDIARINGAIADNERLLREKDRMHREIVARIRGAAAFQLHEQIELYQSSVASVAFHSQVAAEQTAALQEETEACRRQIEQLKTEFRLSSKIAAAINRRLADAGAEDFTLCPDTAACAYRVVRRDGQTAAGLSEGEQQLLAFLYFEQLLQSRIAEGKTVIAVLDDPVTALDPGAASQVTALTGMMQLQCADYHRCGDGGGGLAQMFVMSCQPVLLRALIHEYPVPWEYRTLWSLRRSDGKSVITEQTMHI